MKGYTIRHPAHVRGRVVELAPEALGVGALFALGAAVGKWVFPLPAGDVALYVRYAHEYLRDGQLPQEYPPLAVLPMLAALLPGHPGIGMAVLMGPLVLAIWLLLRLNAGSGAAWHFVAWMTPLAMLALTRYDLAPVICATAGILALNRGRFALAHLCLAAGALLKVYPLALIPIAFMLHVRRDGPRRALEALMLGWAGPLLLLLLLIARQPLQAISWLQIMVHRPVQLESNPATLAWIVSLIGLARIQASTNFHSYSYTSPLDAATGPLLLLLRLVGLLWVYRSVPSRSPAIVAAGAVALLLVTNQCLSPQYVLWLLPLAALAALPPPYRVAIGGVVLLTALDFPVLYHVDMRDLAVLHYPTALLATIAARNLVLVSLAIGLLLAPPKCPVASTTTDDSGHHLDKHPGTRCRLAGGRPVADSDRARQVPAPPAAM